MFPQAISQIAAAAAALLPVNRSSCALTVATEALHYIKELKIESSTLQSCLGNHEASETLSAKIRQVYALSSGVPAEAKLKAEVEEIKRHRVGNCTDISKVAMDFLQQHSIHSECVCFEITYEAHETCDHAMVLIGRDPNSNITDPSTWGNNWALLDGQFQKIYTSENLHQLEVPVLWYTTTTSGYYLRAFDSAQHRFQVLCTKQDFAEGKIRGVGCPFRSML